MEEQRAEQQPAEQWIGYGERRAEQEGSEQQRELRDEQEGSESRATQEGSESRDINPMSERDPHEDDQASSQARAKHREGSLTRMIEEQTAKIPSSVFLTAALGSMAASAVLQFTGRTRWSRFVGMWAPTLLVTGVYNKLVKTFGPT